MGDRWAAQDRRKKARSFLRPKVRSSPRPGCGRRAASGRMHRRRAAPAGVEGRVPGKCCEARFGILPPCRAEAPACAWTSRGDWRNRRPFPTGARCRAAGCRTDRASPGYKECGPRKPRLTRSGRYPQWSRWACVSRTASIVPARTGGGRPIAQAQLLEALEQSAIDQDAVRGRFHEIFRTRDRSSGTKERDLHHDDALAPCRDSLRGTRGQ